MEEDVKSLKEIIKQRDAEIIRLKSILENTNNFKETLNTIEKKSFLSSQDISRYSRQLILPEIGVSGQISLKQTSVLIVGAGGLGCPAGLYLAAAGIGEIGIVDHDVVEINNLHRQIAHTMNSIGEEKSKSLQRAIKEINPSIKCCAYSVLLNSTNVEEIIKPYSIILDASDNVPTRYLLNDVAVLFKKHLVSGSALRFEGQLTVYNYLDGPCYRCLFPKPPAADTVTNCSDGGVLGVITGVIGSLQALEVIKIAAGHHPSYYKKMLLFDGFSGDFRVLKLRSKKSDCEICGKEPLIKKLIDYELFCNRPATDKDFNLSLLPDTERISCKKLKQIFDEDSKCILLDVRPVNEFKICSLSKSINIPIDKLELENSLIELKNLIDETGYSDNYIICRRGNDSQKATVALRKLIPTCTWHDVIGGLHAWHHEIDSSFPLY
ncbi:adenylyltransferase and sulfurtransferase MOCS3-like [Argiope bruennichi]|uniref:Adenylyltransferase and sulfurtransferase MOCS3 homolog n=1 Tax=Argiope bruennichi TaxID=94029 RepID=A0A8T0E291_ARGBR|nr:adenylyltransferase and sulfurtransferase MOCS3-like [Argiope bruennichi]KAF8764275.1 Adenylyltransferase and sulfurtransferase like protein [Argiope bruennichi]